MSNHAESGIKKFRDSQNGLWYNFDVKDVASIDGWRKDRSTNVIQLHGELNKMSSTYDDNIVLDCPIDIKIGDKCPDG